MAVREKRRLTQRRRVHGGNAEKKTQEEKKRPRGDLADMGSSSAGPLREIVRPLAHVPRSLRLLHAFVFLVIVVAQKIHRIVQMASDNRTSRIAPNVASKYAGGPNIYW